MARPDPDTLVSRGDLAPQSPFAPHNRSTAACRRRTSRKSPRRAPTCSLRARPSSTVSQARNAPRPPPTPGTPRAPTARLHARPARARARATAGFRLSVLLSATHHSAPLSPQPRTTRSRSTACARSSPRCPSRARPRSPPKPVATRSRVSARRAEPACDSNLEPRVVAVAEARASSF